jgi:hypothetical protein
MPSGHDHFSDTVNLDDAEPVMRELVSPIADPGTRLSFARVPHHPAEQAPGTR